MTFHGSQDPGAAPLPGPPDQIPQPAPMPPPDVPPAGAMSPDGRYQWNGYQWVPFMAFAAPKKRYGWKIAGGCCGASLVVAIVLVVLFINLIKDAPLSTFPAYPGATQSNFHISTTNGGSSETETWHSGASSDTVESWYAQQLGASPWAIDNRDDNNATWTFHKAGTNGSGTITFLAQGSTTVIEVGFYY